MAYSSQDIRRFYCDELRSMKYVTTHSDPPTSSVPVYAPNVTLSPAQAAHQERRSSRG
jgi:hypothetical protein